MMMKVAGEAAGDVAADDEDGRLQASLVALAIEAALRTGARSEKIMQQQAASRLWEMRGAVRESKPQHCLNRPPGGARVRRVVHVLRRRKGVFYVVGTGEGRGTGGGWLHCSKVERKSYTHVLVGSCVQNILSALCLLSIIGISPFSPAA